MSFIIVAGAAFSTTLACLVSQYARKRGVTLLAVIFWLESALVYFVSSHFKLEDLIVNRPHESFADLIPSVTTSAAIGVCLVGLGFGLWVLITSLRKTHRGVASKHE